MIPVEIHDAWKKFLVGPGGAYRQMDKPVQDLYLADFRDACAKRGVDPEPVVNAYREFTAKSWDVIEAECSKPLLRRLAEKAAARMTEDEKIEMWDALLEWHDCHGWDMSSRQDGTNAWNRFEALARGHHIDAKTIRRAYETESYSVARDAMLEQASMSLLRRLAERAGA